MSLFKHNTKPQKNKHRKKTSKLSNFIWDMIFVVGILICTYPIYSNYMDQKLQYDAVHTYQEHIKETKDSTVADMVKEAKEYNKKLYKFQKTGKADSELSEKNYKKMLSIKGSSAMGTIEIPKIDVDLPIYHGTSDAVLSEGIGHISSSSLPVGGKNTRAALSGHRGLASAKLFTRLDELKKGDLFYIKVGNKTLAYKVFKIETVDPDGIEKIRIEDGKDEVSLVTCTPYAINTHRLVVTGKRTKYIPEVKENIKKGIPSIRELVLTGLPIFIIGYCVSQKIYKSSKKKKRED